MTMAMTVTMTVTMAVTVTMTATMTVTMTMTMIMAMTMTMIMTMTMTMTKTMTTIKTTIMVTTNDYAAPKYCCSKQHFAMVRPPPSPLQEKAGFVETFCCSNLGPRTCKFVTMYVRS